jgi:methionyl-tRNA formyltransferase
MTPALKVIFAGTPEFSVAPLQALIDSPHEVVAVYTQPDRPAGRGRKLTASPVKSTAQAHDIPVYQPENLRDADVQATLSAHHADIMIVVAYGLILPREVLQTPKMGCLNIHASLLPRWRGAAPIQRAIEAGDTETGVTIMQMDEGLDTGDMLYKLTTPISADDTTQTLHDRLSQLGADALMTTLEKLQTGALMPQKQNPSEATYAEKLSKAEAQIQWQEPSDTLVRKIQAFNPWPMAFTTYQTQPLRILQARLPDTLPANQGAPGEILAVEKQGILVATGSTPIWLTQVQPAGKQAMSAYDFAQARQLKGHRFS